jgi:hypothetical protein
MDKKKAKQKRQSYLTKRRKVNFALLHHTQAEQRRLADTSAFEGGVLEERVGIVTAGQGYAWETCG